MTQDAATLATDVLVASPEHYVWWFPGSPIKVHLELSVAQKLKDLLEHAPAGAPQQGLLFGTAVDGITEILDFDQLINVEPLNGVAALPEGRKRSLVGYYRTEPGESLRLNSSDLLLADAFFTKPHHVFLLIQSGALGPPNATFFFRKNDRTMADFPFLEFPLDPDLLAMEERDRLKRSRAAVAVSEPALVALAEPSSTPSPHKPPRSLRKATTWLALGVLIGAAGVALRTLSIRGMTTRLSGAIATPAPAAASSSVSGQPDASMGLTVQRQTNDVKLTWNRASTEIASATSGVLSIREGNSNRQIPLTASQLRSGSVLYSPTSDEVVMQLTVTTPAGALSESITVILPDLPTSKTHVGMSSKPPATPSPESKAAVAAVALIAKASKPFVGIPSVTGSPTGPSPTLSEPPAVTVASRQAPSIPALVSSQFQGPPPMQAPPPSSPAPAAAFETSPSPSLSAEVARSPEVSRPPTVTPPFSPAKPIKKAEPRFPTELKTQINKPRVVEVQVSIDETGKVTRAVAVPQPGISEFFVEATVNAARLWKFQPARRGDQPVPSEMTLQFVLKH